MTFRPPPIPRLDSALGAALRARVDGMAKPPRSLGRLEDLAVQIGQVQDRPNPRLDRVRAYVFAGDHGLNAHGVSAYPSAVTAAMVATFLAGRASVNALARACDVEVAVVDAGVDADLPTHPDLLDRKVRRGSRNAAVEPALTAAEVEAALDAGVLLASEAAAEGVDVIILGEMGIGNTASAALVMSRLVPAALADCIGQGAGHDAEGLARKAAVLARAAARCAPDHPLEVLAEFGGLEIAMMAGALLGAAASRRLVVVDGFIATAAALAAIRLAPLAQDYCVFAHVSAERGHALMLEALGARPFLSLGMRLGEGTGGVLTAPLLRSACRMLAEVASLEDVLAGRL
ncbi:MAG: nicotinate-nucleotide--dimethylbenzimidazole phosphoribosyltransferase [Caulobacteraceae bacterium]|nr:nicotinate-nucleotide--dimethylbenzimidazole phosphoribosyltransferase [Caulobacteraceae bacterium]